MRSFAGRNSVDSCDFGVDPEDVDVKRHDSVDEFRAVAEPLYRRDPVAYTIELTLLRADSFPDDSLLLTVWGDGTPVGAALQTPPYPLACNGIPVNAMDALVGSLAEWRADLTGVRGRRPSAVAFADAWNAATGRAGRISTEERLYRLGTLRAPDAVTGNSRLANEGDRGQLVDWLELFFEEAFSHLRDDGAGELFVDNAEVVGDRFVLWNVDGTPVSMAMLRAAASGVSRAGLHAPGPAWQRLRLGRHRGCRKSGTPQRHAGRCALRRSRQSGIQRNLPAHRLRTGRRFSAHRLHSAAARLRRGITCPRKATCSIR